MKIMESWKYFPDERGRIQYKIYVEDKPTLKKLMKLKSVRECATYCDSKFNIIGVDVIVPVNRIKAIYKLLGIKKQQIKFI